MKKYTSPTLFFLLFIFSFTTVRSQEAFGYKTIDVGGEFQYYSKGYIGVLHLAYNFPIHHAILLRVGYNKVNWKDDGPRYSEDGGGPGFSLGYRYYFLVRPHGFFLGARLDWWHLDIDWRQDVLLTLGKTKLNAIVPSIEAGYMFLINDEFFISPSIAAGVQSNMNVNGKAVDDGFRFLSGISLGWKF